jgi:hypothetical protein
MSETFNAGGFAYKIRTQFSFLADDQKLSRVLGGIAGRDISITGYLQTILPEDARGCSNLVRLVVGSPDSETAADIGGVRSVLGSLDIEFQEDPVIQVLLIAPGIPGILSGIFAALWRRVQVNAMYLGEETRIFVDVSDVCKALFILSQTTAEKSPKRR